MQYKQLTPTHYTSIFTVSTVMYTNSSVCAVGEPKLCSPAANIIQKDGIPSSAKLCSPSGINI